MLQQKGMSVHSAKLGLVLDVHVGMGNIPVASSFLWGDWLDQRALAARTTLGCSLFRRLEFLSCSFGLSRLFHELTVD